MSMGTVVRETFKVGDPDIPDMAAAIKAAEVRAEELHGMANVKVVSPLIVGADSVVLEHIDFGE